MEEHPKKVKRNGLKPIQAKLKSLIEREPFGAFGVRLTNGSEYSFNGRRAVGASAHYHFIVFFGEHDEVVSIPADEIAEIFEGA